MANRFRGSYRSGPTDHGRKGQGRSVREDKRAEAEERNEATPFDRRRAFARSAGFTRNSERLASW